MKVLFASLLLFFSVQAFAATTPASVPQPRPYKVIKLDTPQVVILTASNRIYMEYAVYDVTKSTLLAAFPTAKDAEAYAKYLYDTKSYLIGPFHGVSNIVSKSR